MTLQQLRYVIAIGKHGSFNSAAKNLHVSPPSISALVKDLESERCVSLFRRTGRGIVWTPEGMEVLKYAHQMIDREEDIKERFRRQRERPPVLFSVSSQHYTFVVDVFTKLENSLDADRYALRLKETLPSTVISDVAKQRSEIGVIYSSDFSEKHIGRLLRENNLSFTPLFSAVPHVFVRREHPLTRKTSLTPEDLAPYPCIVYDQNNDVPPYFAEEIVLSDFKPAKTLYVSDLFSCPFMLERCDAYNIGTGLIPEHRDSGAYAALPLEGQTPMTVGWIGLTNATPSPLGERFVSMLREYCGAAAGSA